MSWQRPAQRKYFLGQQVKTICKERDTAEDNSAAGGEYTPKIAATLFS